MRNGSKFQGWMNPGDGEPGGWERPFLSVVVPAYNEEQRLPGTLAELHREFRVAGISYEIIVVDDGSTDRTRAVTVEQRLPGSQVRLVEAPHRGKGHAVRCGMQVAHGTRLVFCDADLPVSAADILRLASQLEEYPVVIATRQGEGSKRVGEPQHRHIMGRLFNALVRLLAVPGVHDTQCGVKCFRAEIARTIFALQSLNGFGFDVELLFISRKLGLAVLEAPVTWYHRSSSRVNPLRDTIRMLGELMQIRLKDIRGDYSFEPNATTSMSLVGGN